MNFIEYYKEGFLYKLNSYWSNFSDCFEDIGGSIINLLEVVFWILILPLVIPIILISPIFNYFTVKKCKDCGSKNIFVTVKRKTNFFFCEECFEKRFYKKDGVVEKGEED